MADLTKEQAENLTTTLTALMRKNNWQCSLVIWADIDGEIQFGEFPKGKMDKAKVTMCHAALQVFISRVVVVEEHEARMAAGQKDN